MKIHRERWNSELASPNPEGPSVRRFCPATSSLLRCYKKCATVAMDRDLELMLLVWRGDAESFDALLARHRAPLINFFLRMVRDHALAEDLAQEVFLRVYNARERQSVLQSLQAGFPPGNQTNNAISRRASHWHTSR